MSDNHLKPFKNTIHKHHSPTAARAVDGVCVDAVGAAKESGHQQSSTTVPDKESRIPGKRSSACPPALFTLFKIADRIDELSTVVSDPTAALVKDYAPDAAIAFVTECMSGSASLKARSLKDSDHCLEALLPELKQSLQLPYEFQDLSSEVEEYWMLNVARITLAAFLLWHHEAEAIREAVEDWTDAVSNCFHAIPHPAAFKDLDPIAKASLLMEEISHYNDEGWPLTDGNTFVLCLPHSDSEKRKAQDFFRRRTDLSAEEVALRMSDCIEAFTFAQKPSDFDPLWKTKNGINPAFLFKHWDAIALEVLRTPELR